MRLRQSPLHHGSEAIIEVVAVGFIFANRRESRQQLLKQVHARAVRLSAACKPVC